MARKKEVAAESAPVVIAYKGFDKNLQCRGFQYEVGADYTHDGKVKACSAGFHACENPFDVWGYYGPFDSRFAVVELSGDLSRESNGDSKIAAGKIKVRAELKMPEFIATAVKWVIDQCKDAGTEDTGNYAQIGSSGNSAQIGSSGDYARIGSGGNYAQIGSSGDSARIGSSGYFAQIKSEGANAVIACAGSVEQFQVGPGGCITVPYHDGKRTRFAVGYEGENIKAGVTYYVNAAGEFVEVQ